MTSSQVNSRSAMLVCYIAVYSPRSTNTLVFPVSHASLQHSANPHPAG